jgi:hypothetical protein
VRCAGSCIAPRTGKAAVDHGAASLAGNLTGPVAGARVCHDDLEVAEPLLRQVGEQTGQEPLLVECGDDDGDLLWRRSLGWGLAVVVIGRLLDALSSIRQDKASREGLRWLSQVAPLPVPHRWAMADCLLRLPKRRNGSISGGVR